MWLTPSRARRLAIAGALVMATGIVLCTWWLWPGVVLAVVGLGACSIGLAHSEWY